MNRMMFLCAAVILFGFSTSSATGQSADRNTLAFWQAARSGNVAEVKRLLDAGVNVDAVTEFNCGAVYFAANRNRADVIELLVERGADVNLRDTDYGFTPVQMAAWLGHTQATELLIDAGATKNDVVGSCYAAASNGHAETVKLIVEKMELPAGQLNALWNTAKSSGRHEVCRVLEQLGATPPEPKSEPEEAGDAAAGQAETPGAPHLETKFDFESDRAMPVVQAENWPAFRGAHRHGSADGQHPPSAFDLNSMRHVKWQTHIEGLGLSSPIIWKDRIYVTTAVSSATRQSVADNGLGWIEAVSEDVPHQWKVLCYDLQTGDLVWQQTACTGKPQTQRHWKASQANSTCVTDGENLIAFFGAQGLYCYDMEGNLKWKKDLGRLDAGWYIDSSFSWGFASSPIIYQDSTIVQCDVYGDPFVAAYSLTDGRELWRTPRENELPSWGTPLVVDGPERDELITNASKAVRGYDPKTGTLLWEIRGNSPITVSSPVAGSGLIVATGGYKTPKPIYVVRAGLANGDVTPQSESESTSVAWSRQNGGTYVVTPLMYRGLLYMCKQNGVLTVYDPETGDQKYQKRLPSGPITASPVAADGKIYFVGENGTVVVISAGDRFEEISVNQLDQSTLASPAISNGTLVFRTVAGLVAIAHEKVNP